MDRLVIGTRGSDLAMWQAKTVAKMLRSRWPGLQIDLEVIRTRGDRPPDTAAAKLPERGMFTREIEAALLAGRINAAVHSLKDLPTSSPEGLLIAAVPLRDDPADVLVAKGGASLADLPAGATVLCGSPRRRAQLLYRRDDLKVRAVGGNVPTRLRKLDDDSDAAAIVLARAGLVRLGLAGRITERFEPADFVPAPGQAALALQARAEDRVVLEVLGAIDQPAVRAEVTAERALLRGLGGGCRAPIGAWGRLGDDGTTLELTGLIASADGRRLMRRTARRRLDDPQAAEGLGGQLAQTMLLEGAEEILRQLASRQADREADW